MNKTLVQSVEAKATNKSGLQKSSMLNRKYVTRPIISVQSVMLEREAQAKNLSSLAENVAQADLKNFQPSLSIPVVDTAEPLAEPVKLAEVPSTEQPEKPLKKITIETPDEPAAPNPFQAAIDAASAPAPEVPRPTPRELKNEAIKKALRTMEDQQAEKAMSKVVKEEKRAKKVAAPTKALKLKRRAAKAAMPKMAKKTAPVKKAEAKEATPSLSSTFKKQKRHSGGRFLLAFATSAAVVAVLAYFVNLNMPTISVKVAAMQTGIEASYPSYVPRGFSLGDVSSDKEGLITISFRDSNDTEKQFTLTEEKSSWDSNALLNNYVKRTYDDNYDVLREQGITIYISGANASWVNGGILYKITNDGANLSKKQIKNIVTSL